jgi:phage-related protein
MAEKSSELENTDESTFDSYSDDRSDDSALATTDDTDIETTSSDTDADVDTTAEPEQIRSQIEETRAQMGETIDAIQEKLSFSNISEQVSEQINSAVETAKDAVYDATIGKAGTFMKNLGDGLSNTNVVQTARDNPFPFLLIGLGVGLLAYNGFGGGKRRSNGRSHKLASAAHEQGGKSTLRSAQEKIGGAASGAYESVSGAASTAVSGVSSAASTAASSVSNAASTAYEGVGNFAGTAYDKVGEFGTQAREQYDYYIEENPLAVGAVALALGAAVGFSIPSTNYEGELMGEARHNLMQKAQDTAGTLVDKVKQVASEAQKTIGEEAKSSGLLGDTGSTGGSSAASAGSSGSGSGRSGSGTQSPGLTPKNS